MAFRYEPPATPLAEAIQYPLDENWEARVLNAYRKTECLKAREHQPKEASHD